MSRTDRARSAPSIRLTLIVHAGLAVGVLLTLAGIGPGPLGSSLIVVLGLLPLALTLPGLMLQRAGTLRWLALVLVLYAGLGCVEVVARRDLAPTAVLLGALLELALVLRMIRKPPPGSARGARES